MVASLIGLFAVIGVLGVVFLFGIGIASSDYILPGVRVMGVAVGNLTQEEAAARLSQSWGNITVRGGGRTAAFAAVSLGITYDAEATAERAYQQGRGRGGYLHGLFTPVNVTPVFSVSPGAAREGLAGIVPQFEQPAVNAGVRLVNGRVQETPAAEGRTIAIDTTVARLQGDPSILADGILELVMVPTHPSVTDASAMVAEAERLLSNPMDIRVYDPVTGDLIHWSVPPEQWSAWLSTTPDPASATGLAFTVNENPVRDYVTTQAGAFFDASRYVAVDEVVESVREALAAGTPGGYVRVYHHDRQHTVQPGETLISIAWDYGVPYPWIQQANGGVEALSVGQTITIPSPDNFLEFPVVPDKRIVVSISGQWVRVYENGQMIQDWPASTGIQSSPTWPGIYQIISHEINAYAANWNLYMPHFMGVYQPIPGSDFTNGFHGFPTRGSSQLLWTNSLGTRVTYGCILVSNTNAQWLYDWAEEGVVVEILP